MNSPVKFSEKSCCSQSKIELDSHSDTCVVGDQCLVVHDHNRPVNVYGRDPKAGSKLLAYLMLLSLILILRHVKLLSC